MTQKAFHALMRRATYCTKKFDAAPPQRMPLRERLQNPDVRPPVVARQRQRPQRRAQPGLGRPLVRAQARQVAQQIGSSDRAKRGSARGLRGRREGHLADASSACRRPAAPSANSSRRPAPGSPPSLSWKPRAAAPHKKRRRERRHRARGAKSSGVDTRIILQRAGTSPCSMLRRAAALHSVSRTTCAAHWRRRAKRHPAVLHRHRRGRPRSVCRACIARPATRRCAT